MNDAWLPLNKGQMAEYIPQIKEQIDAMYKDIKQQPIYGSYDVSNNNFRIHTSSNIGKVCTSYKAADLIDFIYELGIEIEDELLVKDSREFLINKVKNITGFKYKNDVDSWDIERLIYYVSLISNKGELCKRLKSFMLQENLMVRF